MRYFGIVCLLCSLLHIAQADEKVKLPTAEERDKANKLIRDLFKAEYAKTTAAARSELASKLYQQGLETKDDPAAIYELFREAAELAAATNIDLSLKSCAELGQRFQGSLPEIAEPILKTISTRISQTDAQLELAQYSSKLTDDALLNDQFETATRLWKIADGAAQKSKSVRIVKQTQAQAKDLDAYKLNQVKVAKAIEVLKDKPDDPVACLDLGKHSCFMKGDWAKGLPLLAKSSDPKLKAAAEKDLAANEDNANACISAAEVWYDTIAAIEGYPKTQTQRRIQSLYIKALPSVAGLTKTKVEKRLEELAKIIPAAGEDVGVWTIVRTTLREKSYDKLEAMGGAFSSKDFNEIPIEPSILIGFNYTLRRFGDKDLIDHFQAIYLTANGEKLGPAYGNFKAGKKLTIKAKAGYAIGKIAIRGGGLLGGMNIVFMKIEGSQLKADDNYQSGWIGHKDSPDSPFLGDGRLIVGLHGRLQADREGGGICSFGFFVVAAKEKNEKK